MVVHDRLESEVPADKLVKLPSATAWVVRPCERYKEEYSDCRSIKERFHQYFIHGHINECTEWKADYDNCLKYRKTGDEKALDDIVKSEVQRKKKRLEGHFANDVWEKRRSPPPNWNAPLPAPNIERKNRAPSYLGAMQAEAKQNPALLEPNRFTCSVM